MSPQAQRIAIAEACGKNVTAFRFWRKGFSDTEWQESPNYLTKECAEEWRLHEDSWGETKAVESIRSHENTDNYTRDLNAMHEAEEVLTADLCAEYTRKLMRHHPTYCTKVLEKGAELEDIAYETFSIIHATAAQRAEAFLRTIGKWEDDK